MFLKILSHPIFLNLNYHMPMVVDLSHPLVLLTGENGCGKSTLLHSIHYALQNEEIDGYIYKWEKKLEVPKVFLFDAEQHNPRMHLELFENNPQMREFVQMASHGQVMLSMFRETFPSLQDLSESLGTGTFPSSFELSLREGYRDPESLERIARSYGRAPGVDEVRYDLAWLSRLNALMALVRRGGLDLLNVSVGFSTPQAQVPWGPGFLGPVAALVVYLIFQNRSRYVAYHALQAFVFQLIWWGGGGALLGDLRELEMGDHLRDAGSESQGRRTARRRAGGDRQARGRGRVGDSRSSRGIRPCKISRQPRSCSRRWRSSSTPR